MDGIYEVSINTPMGPMNGKVILKTNDNMLEGILEIMGMKHTLSGGKVKGNQCYFKGNIKIKRRKSLICTQNSGHMKN